MHRFCLLSARLAGLILLAALQFASTGARAQASDQASLFGGTFCPGGVKELGMPFEKVRLCPFEEKYLGSIILMDTNFCPRGTAEARGQPMAISQNTALYSLFGSTFGGDDRTKFNLPDLRGKGPTELRGDNNYGFMRYCVVVQGDYPARQ